MPSTIAVPRLAASLILLRDGAAGLEVMMVERTGAASYAAGRFVFPGGTVNDTDAALATRDTADAALRVAAIRETYEECGLLLCEPEIEVADSAIDFRLLLEQRSLVPAIDRLVPFAHWITPPHLPKRFDTHFFLTEAPSGQVATADLKEVVAADWLQPSGIISDAEQGRIGLMFATYMNLRWLLPFTTAASALAAARERAIVTVIPEPRNTAQGKVFCVPADAGYEETEIPEYRFRRS